MSFGLEDFKKTELGKKVSQIILDETNIIKMIALSEHDMPAVQAIGKQLLELGEQVTIDENKKNIGRWFKGQ